MCMALSKAPKLHLIKIKLLCQQLLFFTWLSPFLIFILINATPSIATKFPLPNGIPCQRTGLTGQQSSSLYLPIKNSFLTLSKNLFFPFHHLFYPCFPHLFVACSRPSFLGYEVSLSHSSSSGFARPNSPWFWVTCLPPFLCSSPGVLWDGEIPFQCKMSSCSVIFFFFLIGNFTRMDEFLQGIFYKF